MIQKALQEIARDQAKMGEQIKTLFNQQEETKRLTESVHELATSVKLLASAQKTTEKKVDSLTTDVDEMKAKPAKRWDSLTGIVISVIVTALITYVLTKAGL